MKLPFRKKNKDLLDPATAEQMLSNIFSACKKEPNTVPLEVLVSSSNYRKERFFLQRILLVLATTVFILLPLLFLYPRISITKREGDDTFPVYDVIVSGIVPVKSISASIDGRTVPIYEAGERQYTLQPGYNGDMKVTVSLINRQENEASVTVDNVDTSAPEIVGSSFEEDGIVLQLQDDSSGIAWDSIYLSDEDGELLEPLSMDRENGTLLLDYPANPTDVYIPDNAGNELHLLLTPQSE